MNQALRLFAVSNKERWSLPLHFLEVVLSPLDTLCLVAERGDALNLRRVLYEINTLLRAQRAGLEATAALSGPLPGSSTPLPLARSNFEQHALWQKERALILACRRGQVACVEVLARDADFLEFSCCASLVKGTNALMEAASAGQAACLPLLLNGPAANARDQVGRSALMLAAACDDSQRQGAVECLRALLPVSDPLAVDFHARSALMHAVLSGQAPRVAVLLPVSAVNQCSATGQTALMMAASSGHRDCLALLLPQANARMRSMRSHSSESQTALSCALRHSHWSCADLLGPHSDPREAHQALQSLGAHRLPRTAAFFEHQELATVLSQDHGGEDERGEGEAEEALESTERGARRL